ncbi:MAG: hypothetical protein NVSMB56_02960 [Pyrinomonadaceae bacterium]
MSGTERTHAGRINRAIFAGMLSPFVVPPTVKSDVLTANANAMSATTMRGVEEASNTTSEHDRSSQEFARRAASAPSVKAIVHAISDATSESVSVESRRGTRIWATGA